MRTTASRSSGLRLLLCAGLAMTALTVAPAALAQPEPVDPNPPSEAMRALLNTYGEFERARDRCDRQGMADALRILLVQSFHMEEEADEIEAELSDDGRPIPDGRNRRLDRARADRDRADAIFAQARRDPPRNCPEPEQPLLPAPGRPGHGPAYYASLGGAYLREGDLDLGLVQGTMAIDFSLEGEDPSDEDGSSGPGNARLGPRFRLVGEVSAGILDESRDFAEFRTSSGVRWSAIGLAGIALPIGDADAEPGRPSFTLFGGAGYGFARFGFELEGPGIDFSDSETEDFFAFAAAAEVMFDRRSGLRAAYTRWDDLREAGISANVFSLSYVRRLDRD